MITAFLIQVADTVTNSIPCPTEGSTVMQNIIYLAGGSTATAIINGFFNIESTKQLLGLEADLRLAKQREEHLIEDKLEAEERIKQLTEENAQLKEQQTSGFTNELSTLRQEVSQLRTEKRALQIQLRNGKKPPQR